MTTYQPNHTSLEQVSTKPLFGHQKRKLKRRQKRHKKSHLATTICQEHWQAFLSQQQINTITDEQLIQLYDDILVKMTQEFRASDIADALMYRYKFFKSVSDTYQQKGYEPIVLPAIAYQPKRPTNTNSADAFFYLPVAQAIVAKAHTKWQSQHQFDDTEAMMWLVFSLIVYGGCNDMPVLCAVYERLCQQKPYQLPNGYAMLCVDIESTHYGRRADNKDSGSGSANTSNSNSTNTNTKIYYSRWVILDDVSLLWLNYIDRMFGGFKTTISFDEIITRLERFIQEAQKELGIPTNSKTLASSQFFKHINLFWQLLPNARIDQQMTAVLTGNQRHTAISEAGLLEYFAPVRLPNTELSDDFYQVFGKAQTLPQNQTIQQTLLQTTQQATQQTVQQADNPPFKDDIVNRLRHIMRLERQKDINTALTELFELPLAPNHKRLVHWVIELIKDNNKPSTIQRYLSEIAQVFLSLTHETSFEDWCREDYDELYESLIAMKNPNKPSYTWAVIKSLHHCLIHHYQAPSIAITAGHDALIVADRLISPALYHALIQCINTQQHLSDYHKHLLSVIMSLLYRTGMRIGELLGIRVDDIEYPNTTANYCAILVRPNRYRSLKSDDGTRRLVLSTLLRADEYRRFIDLWHTKRQQNATYLFTPQHHHEPLIANAIYYALSTLLGERYQDITPHSFRHHAISMLALIIGAKDDKALIGFSDYKPKELHKIRLHLLGRQNSISPNHWQSLKAFAGHASLETTFASYIHTADLIAGCQLSCADVVLPMAIVNKLTGKQSSRFNTYAKGSVDLKQQVVHLHNIRPMLIKMLKPQVLTTSYAGNQTTPNQHRTKPTNRANTQKANTQTSHAQKTDIPTQHPSKAVRLLHQYPYYQIDKLLRDIESGVALNDVGYLNFVYDDALFIYQQALTLTKDDATTHKLIGKERKSKSAHRLIAPTPLHYHQEIVLIALCFNNIKQLCQTPKGLEELQNFVRLFYQKVSSNKSQIRFSFKHQKDFYDYCKVAVRILPSQYWRINICQLTNTTDKQLNTTKTQKHIDKFKRTFTDFQGHIGNNQDYNGYTISVIRPNNKGKPNKAQPNSALMKYVVHLLLACGV